MGVIVLCATYWPTRLFLLALAGTPVLVLAHYLVHRFWWFLLGVVVAQGTLATYVILTMDKTTSIAATWLAALDVRDATTVFVFTGAQMGLLSWFDRKQYKMLGELRWAFMVGQIAAALYTFYRWITEFNSYTSEPETLLPNDLATRAAMVLTAILLVAIGGKSRLVQESVNWTQMGTLVPQMVLWAASALDLAPTACVLSIWLLRSPPTSAPGKTSAVDS